MQLALQLKGVTWTSMDFDKELFTITVEDKIAIRPSEIVAAVPKRYKAASIAVVNLRGEAIRRDEALFFKAKGTGLEFEIKKDDKSKPMENVLGKALKVSGEIAEETRKDKAGKETKVLTLAPAVVEVEKK